MTDPPGDYVYTLEVDLDGFDPSTAVVSGQWASDDGAFIVLNSANTGIITPDLFRSLQRFTLNGGFASAISQNSLDIEWRRSDVASFLSDLNARGLAALPELEQELFDLYELDAAFREVVVTEFLRVNDAEVPLTLTQSLLGGAASIRGLAAVYGRPEVIPEPATVLLLAAALVVLAVRWRR